MPKKAYLLPFNEHDLNNRIFKLEPGMSHGATAVYPYVRQYLLARDIELNTMDLFDFDHPEPDAVLVVLNHYDSGRLKRYLRKIKSLLSGNYFGARQYFIDSRKYLPYFKQRILLQWECPAVIPYPFSHVPEMMKTYHRIFSSIKRPPFEHFFLPQSSEAVLADKFEKQKRKYLTLISSNKTGLGRENELYSERLRAIRYFSDKEFDLYGTGWECPLARHYRSFSPYVRRAYRGEVTDKHETTSNYTFAICYENAGFEGYITEKIFDCFVVGTIPIYCGAPDVESYIPKQCFIDFRDFSNYNALDAYLRGLSEEQIESYRAAAREYVRSSEKFKLFSREHFSETLRAAISRAFDQE